jgi:hypothetical protein
MDCLATSGWAHVLTAYLQRQNTNILICSSMQEGWLSHCLGQHLVSKGPETWATG